MEFSKQEHLFGVAAIPFSRGFSQPRDQTGLLHHWQIPYHLSHQGSPNNENLTQKKKAISWRITLFHVIRKRTHDNHYYSSHSGEIKLQINEDIYLE